MKLRARPSWQLSLILVPLINIAVARVDTPIEIKGSKFFYSSNGTQFYARGITYSPSGLVGASYVDALADITTCTRDVPYLSELNINVVVVSGIDPANTHKACLQLFAANDIYILVDLSTVPSYINITAPQWTTETFNAVTPVIDEFSAYFNTLGFYAWVEIERGNSGTALLPFPKAAARDIKNYIQQNQYRTILVGYAAEAGPTLDSVAAYMDCGAGEPSVDFFAFGEFSWCGDSSYTESGDTAISQRPSNHIHYPSSFLNMAAT